MLFVELFFRFFKVGLFSVGGGLATIPFLREMSVDTGWFTEAALADMIAVSESTPGAMGVNMATYVGFETAGVPGAVIATLGLVTPSVIVILIIAGFLQRFRQSSAVDAVFYGLRPASTALITAAGISVAAVAFTRADNAAVTALPVVHWGSVVLAVAVFVGMKWTPLKKLHPVAFIAISAVIGIIFKF